MSTDLILSFLISNVGFWFFVRRTTHQSSVYTSIFTSRWFFHAGATIFCLFFIFFDESPLILGIFIGVLLFFLSALPNFLRHQQEKKFIDGIPHTLEMVILAMKSGQSLKNGVKSAVVGMPFAQKMIWNAIILDFDGPTSGAQSPKFSNQALFAFAKDLKSVHLQKAKTIEAVKSLHQYYETVNNFRHRSRQAALQSRIQGGLLTLFFVPALIYQMFFKSTDPFFGIIATLLFGAGLLSSLYLGGKRRWKI